MKLSERIAQAGAAAAELRASADPARATLGRRVEALAIEADELLRSGQATWATRVLSRARALLRESEGAANEG